MKTIVMTVDDEKSDALLKHIESTNLTNYIEVYDEDEDTPEEIRTWDERWENYKRNPDTTKSWEEIRENIKQKYGF